MSTASGASPPLRLGILGLGLIAQSVHLPNLAGPLAGRFCVTHVCDLSAKLAELIASDLGARPTTAAEAVIADPGVDAVLICTPGAHAGLARQALEAGKHVFAEKPYAYDPAIAEADGAFAAERALALQIGYMKMYEPVLAMARARMEQIGPLRLVRMTVLHPSDERQTQTLNLKRFDDVPAEAVEAARAVNVAEVSAAIGTAGTEIDPVLFRNVLHGSVCHQTSVLRALFPGAPAHLISAHADRPGSQRSEPPKLQILGRIEDGPDWSLSWNWLTHFPEYREWVEIYGDRGAMRIDFPGPYSGGSAAPLTVTLCDGPGFSEQVLQPRGSAFALELEAFHAAITEGAPILSDAAGAARDAALLRAMAAELGV